MPRLGLGMGMGAYRTVGNVFVPPTPMSLFTHVVDFATPATLGDVAINYANNSNDGRPFRDQSNFTICFCENADLSLVSIGTARIRRTDLGYWNYVRGSNRCKWNCDIPGGITATNWVATNVTAAKDQTSGDGTANNASSITATANGGTLLQTDTLAVNNLLFQAKIKRLVGTGTIEMTLNGGTNWIDVTSQITAAWSLPYMTLAAVTNPTFGLRFGTSGDKIAFEFGDVWITSVNNVLRPQRYYNRQTTTQTNVAQCRIVADVADLGLWNGRFLTPYALYCECSSEGDVSARAVVTGITDTFCSINGDGSVTFSQGGGATATTATGAFTFGRSNVNKICAQVKADGSKQVACNGVVSTITTGATFPVSLDHIDIGTNGSAARSLHGVMKKIAIENGLFFNSADLITLTT